MLAGRINRLKATVQFCIGRLGPYGELLKLELALYRHALVMTILGYVGLVLCALFGAAFISIAILVTYWDSTSRTAVAWWLAGGWCFLGLLSYCLARVTAPKGEPFGELVEQFKLDMDAVGRGHEQAQNRSTKG